MKKKNLLCMIIISSCFILMINVVVEFFASDTMINASRHILIYCETGGGIIGTANPDINRCEYNDGVKYYVGDPIYYDYIVLEKGNAKIELENFKKIYPVYREDEIIYQLTWLGGFGGVSVSNNSILQEIIDSDNDFTLISCNSGEWFISQNQVQPLWEKENEILENEIIQFVRENVLIRKQISKKKRLINVQFIESFLKFKQMLNFD